jgi:hypothetical protein
VCVYACTQVGRGLRCAQGKRDCVVLDVVGVTWRFGPLTGALRSDYQWEEAVTSATSKPAKLLRHCARCGALVHRDVLSMCPGCSRGAKAASTASDGVTTAYARGELSGGSKSQRAHKGDAPPPDAKGPDAEVPDAKGGGTDCAAEAKATKQRYRIARKPLAARQDSGPSP